MLKCSSDKVLAYELKFEAIMTKKTFLFMGLFVLAMSAFWTALDTYLILDSVTFDGFDARGVVLRTLGIPILFGVIKEVVKEAKL